MTPNALAINSLETNSLETNSLETPDKQNLDQELNKDANALETNTLETNTLETNALETLDFSHIPSELELAKNYRSVRDDEEFRVDSEEAFATLEAKYPNKDKPRETVTRQEIAESNRKQTRLEQTSLEEKGVVKELPEEKEPIKEKTFAGKAKAVGKDIAGGLLRAPKEIGLGLSEGINEILGIIDEAGTYLNELTGLPQTETKIKIPKGVTDFLKGPKEARTVTGDIIKDLSQFAVGMIGVGTALKAFKIGAATGAVGKVAEAAGKFAAADTLAFSAHEERLANVMDKIPALKGAVTGFLKTDPDDSFAEAKFKQLVEGSLVGVAAETLFSSVKAYRAIRALKDKAKEAKKIKTKLSEEALEKELIKKEESIIEEGVKTLGDPESKELFLHERLEKSFKETEGLADPTIKNIGDSINMFNINTEADVLELFGEVSKLTKGKKYKSLAETVERSKGLDGVKTLFKDRKGQPWNEDQVAAAKLSAAAIYNKFIEVSKIAAHPNALAPDLYNARKMLAITNLTFESIEGGKRASSLSLGAWRIKGEDAKTFKQMQSILDSTGGFNANQDLFKKIAANVEGLSKEQMRTVIQKGPYARTRDGLIDAWRWGMLSSPNVQVKNFSSTTIAALAEIPKSFLASLPKDSAIVKEESLYMMYGFGASLKEAFAKGAAVFKNPELSKSTKPKWDMPEMRPSSKEALDYSGPFIPIAYGIDFLGAVNKAVALKPMAFTDELSRTVLEKMKIYSLAARQGVNSGLKGDKLYKYVGEYVKNPSEAELTTMKDFAEMSLFFTKLGTNGQAGQKIISKNPLLKVPFPFVRTSINVAKYNFKHSPLGFISKTVRDDIAAGGSRKAEALARIGLGSASMATFVDLTLQGTITDSGPVERSKRELLMSSGWRPNSIRIGGEYVSYQVLGTFGTMIGWAADMATILFNYDSYDKAEQDKVDELSSAINLGLSNNVFDQTYLGSLTRTLEAVQDPLGAGKRYMEQLGASLIPGFVSKAAQITNPEAKQINNLLDAWKTKIPFLRDGVPARRDVFGKPLKTYYPSFDGMKGIPYVGKALSTVTSYFNPLYQSDARDPTLSKYLNDNGFPISYPSLRQEFKGSMINLRENPEIYSRLLELRGSLELDKYEGMNLEDYLASLINQDTLRGETFFSLFKSHDDQKRMISTIVSDYQKAAKNELLIEYPILEQKIADNKQGDIKAAKPVGFK